MYDKLVLNDGTAKTHPTVYKVGDILASSGEVISIHLENEWGAVFFRVSTDASMFFDVPVTSVLLAHGHLVKFSAEEE